jgi:hypothetical protein
MIRLLTNLINQTCNDFFTKEKENILSGIHEQNLTGRLAMYLTLNLVKINLNEYFVDTEYNRKQDGLLKTIVDDKMTVHRIIPDIIIHSRGKFIKNDNLLVIEMKKSSGKESDKEENKERLKLMTRTSYDGVWCYDGKTHPKHVCGYLLGV